MQSSDIIQITSKKKAEYLLRIKNGDDFSCCYLACISTGCCLIAKMSLRLHTYVLYFEKCFGNVFIRKLQYDSILEDGTPQKGQIH